MMVCAIFNVPLCYSTIQVWLACTSIHRTLFYLWGCNIRFDSSPLYIITKRCQIQQRRKNSVTWAAAGNAVDRNCAAANLLWAISHASGYVPIVGTRHAWLESSFALHRAHRLLHFCLRHGTWPSRSVHIKRGRALDYVQYLRSRLPVLVHNTTYAAGNSHRILVGDALSSAHWLWSQRPGWSSPWRHGVSIHVTIKAF